MTDADIFATASFDLCRLSLAWDEATESSTSHHTPVRHVEVVVIGLSAAGECMTAVRRNVDGWGWITSPPTGVIGLTSKQAARQTVQQELGLGTPAALIRTTPAVNSYADDEEPFDSTSSWVWISHATQDH